MTLIIEIEKGEQGEHPFSATLKRVITNPEGYTVKTVTGRTRKAVLAKLLPVMAEQAEDSTFN